MDDVCICIYGLAGTGKTTTLAAIATASLNGKPFLDIPPHERVFSTVPIAGCYKLEPDMLGVYDLADSLLLIDEATMFFDCRHWKSTPKWVLDFFAIHRHEKISVVLFTQTFNGCDSRIRDLAHFHYLLHRAPLGFSIVKPIQHIQDIFNFKPDDRYKLAPPTQWKLIYRAKYYKIFDSYAALVKYKPLVPEKYDGLNPLVKPKFRLKRIKIRMSLGAHSKPVESRLK